MVVTIQVGFLDKDRPTSFLTFKNNEIMKKNWTKITSLLILLSASADTIFNLLEQIGFEETTINVVKLIGLLISILLPSVAETKVNSFSQTSGKGAVIPDKGF